MLKELLLSLPVAPELDKAPPRGTPALTHHFARRSLEWCVDHSQPLKSWLLTLLFDIGHASRGHDQEISTPHGLVSSTTLPATEPTLPNAMVDLEPATGRSPTAPVPAVMQNPVVQNSLSVPTLTSPCLPAPNPTPSVLPPINAV